MADLKDAFNYLYKGRPYKPILNQNQSLDKYFERVKITNSKYDNMPKNKNSTYAFECKTCHKPAGIHMKMQKIHPHEFIQGQFRKLNDEEAGF